jgi:hypothetical protein
MTAEIEQDTEISQSRRVVMEVIHYGLLGFAMWASYLHWYALVRHDGQPKIESAFIAGCVDLSVYLATLYRQRDHRIGRKASFGFCTFPNFALFSMICVSAAGNVAEAKPTFGGVSVALIPTITFLLALTLGERDLAETDRRRARLRAEAKAQIEAAEAERRRQAEDAEAERQRQAEAERLRAEARAEEEWRLAEAERQRQERERQRHEREQRRAEFGSERHGEPSPSRGGAVTANVTGAALRVVPPAEARAKSPERQAMWGHWVHVIKTESRLPSGEELRAAGGCNEGSAAGRIAAREWRAIEPAKSLLQREATGS